jgi:hypothetical protein
MGDVQGRYMHVARRARETHGRCKREMRIHWAMYKGDTREMYKGDPREMYKGDPREMCQGDTREMYQGDTCISGDARIHLPDVLHIARCAGDVQEGCNSWGKREEE